MTARPVPHAGDGADRGTDTGRADTGRADTGGADTGGGPSRGRRSGRLADRQRERGPGVVDQPRYDQEKGNSQCHDREQPTRQGGHRGPSAWGHLSRYWELCLPRTAQESAERPRKHHPQFRSYVGNATRGPPGYLGRGGRRTATALSAAPDYGPRFAHRPQRRRLRATAAPPVTAPTTRGHDRSSSSRSAGGVTGSRQLNP